PDVGSSRRPAWPCDGPAIPVDQARRGVMDQSRGAAPGMARPVGLSLDQACHLNCCSLRAELCDRTMLTRAGPLNFIASSSAFLMSFGSLTKAPKPPKASITLS